MDKTVEAFDPETVQLYKGDQGQVRVQVVADWSICPGLKRGKEYKRFFKWAKSLNNYHPDIKDISFRPLCRIRYQTKLYFEGVNILNVYSQEKQEFFRCYFNLQQWPEFLQPKELFAVMNNDQAQDQAEKILQKFEIENDTILGTDASELQDLTPYVKRFFQRFTGIKEFRKKVYPYETSSCIEQMKKSPLHFNPDALNVRGFLTNKQQQVM